MCPSLENLPFKQGDEVERIILERSSSKIATDSYPLKGTVIRYDEPLEPATSAEDWESLKWLSWILIFGFRGLMIVYEWLNNTTNGYKITNLKH